MINLKIFYQLKWYSVVGRDWDVLIAKVLKSFNKWLKLNDFIFFSICFHIVESNEPNVHPVITTKPLIFFTTFIMSGIIIFYPQHLINIQHYWINTQIHKDTYLIGNDICKLFYHEYHHKILNPPSIGTGIFFFNGRYKEELKIKDPNPIPPSWIDINLHSILGYLALGVGVFVSYQIIKYCSFYIKNKINEKNQTIVTVDKTDEQYIHLNSFDELPMFNGNFNKFPLKIYNLNELPMCNNNLSYKFTLNIYNLNELPMCNNKVFKLLLHIFENFNDQI